MDMRGYLLRCRNSLRPRRVNAGGSHKQRNVLNALPRRERGAVQAELVGIWDQPSKQEALVQLAARTRQIQQALSGKRCEAWQRRKRRRSRFMTSLHPCTATFRPPMPLKACLAMS